MSQSKHQQRLKELRRRWREDDKFRQEATMISINTMCVVPVYVLMDDFKWGRKRLSRFIRRYSKVIDDVAHNRVRAESLAEEIMRRTKLEYEDGAWMNVMLEDKKKEG